VLIQQMGAGLLALGFLDGLTRFTTIGGLYGRPVPVVSWRSGS